MKQNESKRNVMTTKRKIIEENPQERMQIEWPKLEGWPERQEALDARGHDRESPSKVFPI
jgi:hypothetical protein